MFYRADTEDVKFSSCIESLETRLFEEHKIPWQELAFSVVELTLQRNLNERKNDDFSARSEVINQTNNSGW
jgi:hypothetical protein